MLPIADLNRWPIVDKTTALTTELMGSQSSHTGIRTRASWVKANYPYRTRPCEKMCIEWDSNPRGTFGPEDVKSTAFDHSAIHALQLVLRPSRQVEVERIELPTCALLRRCWLFAYTRSRTSVWHLASACSNQLNHTRYRTGPLGTIRSNTVALNTDRFELEFATIAEIPAFGKRQCCNT